MDLLIILRNKGSIWENVKWCEAGVKACAARRAHEVWFLADDTKFGSIYPAVIAGLQNGSILTNRCPDPRYRQQTLVKEAEA